MTLILDLPCQDNDSTFIVDDISAFNNDGLFQQFESLYYSIVDAPIGSTYPRSFNGGTLFANDDSINVLPAIFIDPYLGGCISFFTKITLADFLAIFSETVFDGYGFMEWDSNGTTATIYISDVGGTSVTLANVPVGEWKHYAFNFKNDATVELYINGVFFGTFEGVLGTLVSFNRLAFNDFNGPRYWQSPFFGIKVYDNTLTAAEIITDAEIGGLGPPAPEPTTSYDINRINNDLPVNYSQVLVYYPNTDIVVRNIGTLNINELQNKYDNRFKNQPPLSGATY